MKQFAKRGLAMLLALVMSIGLLAGLSFTASAATVDYVYGTASYDGDTFTNVIYNWGEREETATFLSPNAEEFYTNDYTYENLSGLKGDALYAKLSKLMTDKHTYETDYDETRALLPFTDCENSGYYSASISGFYSGADCGSVWDPSMMNREHTWPKSKSLGGVDEDDIMMLRPESPSVNSSRGNKAYGPETNADYFNPNQSEHDVRGDVARIILYVYVRWGNDNLYGADGVIQSQEVLLQWMEEDPVDTWELGRNDSVESVTGTRNVFVDYPELAFLLFNEEIPADMTTPSGEAYKSEYTITATAGAHGSVLVNGNTVTAFPEEGYEVAGYTVTDGTAAVSRDGDIFTVTASSDCTIHVEFAARKTVKANYIENGQLTGSDAVYAGEVVTLPNVTAAPEGYTFVGWSVATVEDTETLPAVYQAGENYKLEANTTFYAVYSHMVAGGAGVWTLVTDASVLQDGVQVVIAYAAKSCVAGTRNSSKAYLTAVNAAFSNDKKVINELPADATILTLVKTSDAWQLKNASGQLLGANTNKKVFWNSGNRNWKITVTSAGKATILDATTTNNKLQYNASSPRFTVYTSTQQLPELYYLNTSAGTLMYTTGLEFTCDHSTAEAKEEVKATCKLTGVKAHSYCSVCDTYLVDGAEVAYDSLILAVDATNHVGDTYLEGYREATCNAPGYSGDIHCADCGGLLESGTETTVDHSLVHNDGMPASCLGTGTKAYDYCDVCGKCFIDGVEVGQEDLFLPVDPNNHGGETHIEGHQDASCGVEGYTGDVICECGGTVEVGETIPATGNHGETEIRGAEEATTEKEGYTGDVHCTVCGDLLEKGNVIPKKESDNTEDEKPEDEKPEDEKPEDEKPEDEKPEDEKPEDEKPEDEKPEDEKPEDEKPEDEKPEDEKPEDEKPEDEKPEDEKPEDEKPEEDIPQTGDAFALTIAQLVISACGMAVTYLGKKRKY